MGQPEAVELLETAVRHRADGVFHSWLITGPPGSGRSNIALAFAAFLDAVRSGRPPELDGLEGRKAVAIVEACYASARTGKVVRVADPR